MTSVRYGSIPETSVEGLQVKGSAESLGLQQPHYLWSKQSFGDRPRRRGRSFLRLIWNVANARAIQQQRQGDQRALLPITLAVAAGLTIAWTGALGLEPTDLVRRSLPGQAFRSRSLGA